MGGPALRRRSRRTRCRRLVHPSNRAEFHPRASRGRSRPHSPWNIRMSDIRQGVLTVVIPALNEEEAIAGTISRCLAAREQVEREAGLAGVEVIVVSDGSTDRTVEIARGFDEVKVIVFEQNR